MQAFPKYESYKDSGVAWLGEIPSHWKVLPIKRMARKALGSFIDGDWIESPYIQDEGIRLIQTGNIGTGFYKEQGNRYISEKTFRELSCTEVFSGDVLICRLAYPVGRACLAPDLQERMITSVDNCILRTKELIHPPFVVYALSSQIYLNYIESICRGGTRDRISRSMLGAIKVQNPPMGEQQRIAAFLDQKTAEIDEAIDKKQRLIDLLQEQKAILINQAVTQGLNPNVAMRDSGVEWIGEIPEHWEASRISRLFCEKDETGYPDLPLLVVSINSGVTLRDMEDENHRQIASDYNVYKRALRGDISFNKMRMWQGAVGVVPEDGLVSPDYVVARPIAEMNVYYFEYLFRTEQCKAEFLGESHGIVMDRNRLYWEDFKSIYVSQPPKREQDEIYAYIRSLNEEVAKVVDATNREISTLQEYKSVLISNAVTGKIKV